MEKGSPTEKRITIVFNDGDNRRLQRVADTLDVSQNEVIRLGLRLLDSMSKVLNDESARIFVRSDDNDREKELLISL
jgi:hypothetical protein